MSTTVSRYSVKRSDAIGLWAFMLAGAGIAVWTAVSAISRIIEVLPNRNVRVPAEFSGTPARAPIGPDGAETAVELSNAVLTVPQLPVAALWAIVIQQGVLLWAVLAAVVALVWLGRNVVGGTIFSRTNTALVSVAGAAGLLGLAGVPFFGNMAANGAFAALSERSFDNELMSLDPFSFILLAFVGALLSTVFAIGERMQRDTEGLV